MADDPKKFTLAKASRAQLRFDSLTNNLTGMGFSKFDRRLSTSVREPLIFSDRYIVDALYHGNDIANKMANVPAQDMVREGFEIDVDDDETLGSLIVEKLFDLMAPREFEDALTFALAFGGAAILPIVDDGTDLDQWSEPLDLSRVREVSSLMVFDRFELDPMGVDIELGTNFGKPLAYRINMSSGFGGASAGFGSGLVDANGRVLERTSALKSAFQSLPIHHSRLLMFQGMRSTRYRREVCNRGFDDSIYVQVWEALRDFLSMWGSLGNVMTGLGTLTYGIKDYAGMAAESGTNGKQLLDIRLQEIVNALSSFRAVPFDAENEQINMMGLPLAGVSEITSDYQMRLSAAVRMPVTKLFGRSAAGMNATGEGDRKDYKDRIKYEQHTKYMPPLKKLIKMMLASDEFGNNSERDYQVVFNPLEQLNDVERAQARNAQANTDATYIQTGVLDVRTVREERFGGKYSFETTLSQEQLTELEAQDEERRLEAERLRESLASSAESEDNEDEGDNNDVDEGARNTEDGRTGER